MTIQPRKKIRERRSGVGISVLSMSLYNKLREPVVEVTEFGTFQYVWRTQLAIVISRFVPLHSPLLKHLHCPVRGLFLYFLLYTILCWLIAVYYSLLINFAVLSSLCCFVRLPCPVLKKSKEMLTRQKKPVDWHFLGNMKYFLGNMKCFLRNMKCFLRNMKCFLCNTAIIVVSVPLKVWLHELQMLIAVAFKACLSVIIVIFFFARCTRGSAFPFYTLQHTKHVRKWINIP